MMVKVQILLNKWEVTIYERQVVQYVWTASRVEFVRQSERYVSS